MTKWVANSLVGLSLVLAICVGFPIINQGQFSNGVQVMGHVGGG